METKTLLPCDNADELFAPCLGCEDGLKKVSEWSEDGVKMVGLKLVGRCLEDGLKMV
jgi:hypothetical protein|eukprot:CAMPEP_0174308548 /NCGR_PEP_ID=MMETSP0810-20121108/1833_1 /TAXON_ID=73025 ORGANISM="Eutreptiella gymnastica-like, Strain CCMP1594" /NCGR_SAMPLE_ID=MMETSP0810 /ASSEMBLY_ACC=CAM_ASM_000659 /LENGTH=56 /DNA_ID=CAMNT_0015415917 /DNA_START=1704 /DNA_END=1874 /DNA_ORIENTATION=-